MWLLVTLPLLAATFFVWRNAIKPKPWSDDRPVEGAIYSVATGRRSDGCEIVVAVGFIRPQPGPYHLVLCCYDAETGSRLWEHDEPRYGDLRGLQIHLAMDSAGDLFLTSHHLRDPSSPGATIQKLSGISGKPIWTRDIKAGLARNYSGTKIPGYLDAPQVDSQGHVWLIDIKYSQSADSKIQRLVKLDGHNGKPIFETDIDGVPCRDPERMEVINGSINIHCSSEGTATVFASDFSGNLYFLRYSGNGQVISRINCRMPAKISDARQFVDEEHERVTFSGECWRGFCTAKGPEHVHMASFSMKTGTNLWEEVHEVNRWNYASPSGHLHELAELRSDGDLVLRNATKIEQRRILWTRWPSASGIPVPLVIRDQKNVSAIQLVSGLDGSTKKVTPKTKVANWFQIQCEKAGSSTLESFTVLSAEGFQSGGRMRCADARQWLRDPSGSRPVSFRSVRTPSGRTILSRDPWGLQNYSHDGLGCNWRIKGL